MILFDNWTLSVTGLAARQYDNLSRRIDIEGDLPAGYDWQLLVQSGGDADTLLLQPTESGVGAVLTADNLSKSGEYYFQLRGTLEADGVTTRHTNVVSAFVPESLTGLGTWPEVPTEFAQIEQRCTTAMIAAESAAEAAKADADRAAALAAEVTEKAAQTAQDATESAQAKEAAQTAQRLADEAQSAAEAARNAAETAQAAAEQSATDAVGAKQGAEAALKAAKAQADAAALSASGAAQSAQQAAESAAVYDTVVADVNQLKQDIADITPDDTAVDGKPWTSKKIVDSLCMPFEESGNPVQYYPVENYPLVVKVQMDPVQEGSGDPSPDNIRPITGRDAVSVTRCGKNLIDVKPIEGAKWGTSYIDMVNALNKLPVGVYILSFDMTLTSFKDNYTSETASARALKSVMIVNGTNIAIDAGIIVYRNTVLPLNRHAEYTLHIGEDEKGRFEKFYLYSVGRDSAVEGAPDGSLGYGRFYNYQIELGSTATPYEPYTGSTTDIALPETVYGGTLDVETGVVTVEYGHIASYAGEALPGEWISDRDVYSAGAVPTTGAQVVYKLAEPITIQLSPKQIAALSGVNTIYTDADGAVVTGAEDPKHTITELKNAIISLGGNV